MPKVKRIKTNTVRSSLPLPQDVILYTVRPFLETSDWCRFSEVSLACERLSKNPAGWKDFQWPLDEYNNSYAHIRMSWVVSRWSLSAGMLRSVRIPIHDTTVWQMLMVYAPSLESIYFEPVTRESVVIYPCLPKLKEFVNTSKKRDKYVVHFDHPESLRNLTVFKLACNQESIQRILQSASRLKNLYLVSMEDGPNIPLPIQNGLCLRSLHIDNAQMYKIDGLSALLRLEKLILTCFHPSQLCNIVQCKFLQELHLYCATTALVCVDQYLQFPMEHLCVLKLQNLCLTNMKSLEHFQSLKRIDILVVRMEYWGSTSFPNLMWLSVLNLYLGTLDNRNRDPLLFSGSQYPQLETLITNHQASFQGLTSLLSLETIKSNVFSQMRREIPCLQYLDFIIY